MFKVIGAAAAALLLATLIGTAAPAGAQDTASVTLVHAAAIVPDSPSTVTVCVDGAPAIAAFNLGDTVTVDLPAGTYDGAIFLGADQDCAGEPALRAPLTVSAGDNVSVIAHLRADGSPTITVLPNPVACTPVGEGRLVARHMAVAGPVDAIVDGELLPLGLTNANQVSQDLPAGTYAISVVAAADTSQVVVPTTDVTITDASVTILTVYGNNDGAPIGVIAQSIAVASCPAVPVAPEIITSSPTFTG
jgi:hypothetical protein